MNKSITVIVWLGFVRLREDGKVFGMEWAKATRNRMWVPIR